MLLLFLQMYFARQRKTGKAMQSLDLLSNYVCGVFNLSVDSIGRVETRQSDQTYLRDSYCLLGDVFVLFLCGLVREEDLKACLARKTKAFAKIFSSNRF
jgi:hypothetical protein